MEQDGLPMGSNFNQSLSYSLFPYTRGSQTFFSWKLLQFFIQNLVTLKQGSQTQIHRGATFGWKMSLRARAQFWILKALRAAIWKNVPYLVHQLAIFDHFFCFSMINFLILKELRAALTPYAGHMRPAGRVFETHALKATCHPLA